MKTAAPGTRFFLRVNTISLLVLSAVSVFLAGCERLLCTFGGETGCTEVAESLIIKKDAAGAADYFEKACSHGGAIACSRAGDLWLDGVDGSVNVSKAAALFRKSCEGSVPEGCLKLGRMLAGSPSGYIEAAQVLDKSCNLKNYDGCAELGKLYEQGVALSPDSNMAFYLYDNGCRHDNALSCLLEGRLSVEQEKYTEAADFLSRSCQLGSADGCIEAAFLNRGNTPGIPENTVMVKDFLEKSCRLRSASGCYELAELLKHERNGAGQDEVQTHQVADLYGLACELGHGHSCHITAEMMLAGQLLRARPDLFRREACSC